jgi:arginase family enzyme
MSLFKKEEQKEEKQNKEFIQDLGLKALHNYFKVDVDSLDEKTIKLLHQKARLGMTFEKEMNLSKRAVEQNYLRVFKLVAEDKKELKALIKKSIPKYLP